MLSALFSHNTIADACNSFYITFIYCDQYCTATIYSATCSARGTHIVYVFPNKQSINQSLVGIGNCVIAVKVSLCPTIVYEGKQVNTIKAKIKAICSHTHRLHYTQRLYIIDLATQSYTL